MSTTISLGPLLIPGTVLVILGALLSGRLVLWRLSGEHGTTVPWILDRGSTAAVVAFLVWKLWPLTTWWQEIVEDPMILLRLPGGTTGVIVGGIAGLAVLAPGLFRNRERLVPFGAAILGAAVGGFLTLAILTAADDGTPADLTAPGGEVSVELLNPVSPDHSDGAPGDNPDAANSSSVSLVNDARPTVITFWATWCGPCRAELPVKQRFYREYAVGPDRVADFVAVNMTNTESSTGAVVRYLEEHGIAYPVGLDRTGSLAGRLSVRGTPTTIIVSPTGDIIDRWTGPSSLERLVRGVR